MKIFVKAKTGQKEERVEAIDNTHFIVRVKERPVDGKANEAILAALSNHFKIPRYNFILRKGHSITSKVIEIV